MRQRPAAGTRLSRRFQVLAFCLMVLSLTPQGASLHGQAPSRLPGILGLAWGASRSAVKSDIASHGLFRLSSEDDVYAYFDGPFLGRESQLALGFLDNKMFLAVVTFRGSRATAISGYRGIVKELSSQFGQSTETTELFQPPYLSGDGREAEALAGGKAIFQTVWRFRDGNELTAFIDAGKPGTVLMYANKALVKLYEEGLKR